MATETERRQILERQVSSADSMCRVLNKLNTGLSYLLASAKLKLEECGTTKFVDDHIGCLMPAMPMYSESIRSLGVTTRTECQKVVSENFSTPEVKDGLDDLMEIENEWDQMLKDLDSKLSNMGDPSQTEVKVGDPAPMDIPLIDARTGEGTSIREHFPEGTKALVLVLLRHFA